MKRFTLNLVRSLLLLLVCCAFLHGAPEEAPKDRPNIIFIFADDWGWGDLTSHAHPYVQTPNLDRIANEGTDFRQFYVSNPVCSASRVAVMTGQYPARFSVHQHFWNTEMHRKTGQPDWLDPKATTLPRILQHAGYRTGHFGKWHLSSELIKDAPPTSAYGYDESIVFRGPGPQMHPNDAVDAAIDFVEANKDQAFFINLWIHETHAPYYPSEEALKHFSYLDEQDRVYAATIRDADQRIGRLLRTLDRLGLAKNTIVAFSSDNGPEVLSIGGDGPRPQPQKHRPGYPDSEYGSYYCVGSSGGLRAHKRSIYEGGVRVPFLIRWPGRIPAGRVNEQAVLSTVDLLLTFSAAAGAPIPNGYVSDGENVLPILRGETNHRHKPLFWEWKGYSVGESWPRLAVRDGDWKLLMTEDRRRIELYSIPDDRAEVRNVAHKHPELVERLSAMVLGWQSTLPSQPPADCISKF